VGADADALRCWEGVRLERCAPRAACALRQRLTSLTRSLLAEHLLRSGQPQAGAALASAAGVGALVDTALHGEVAAVAASLRRGDAQPALAWCDEHRARLKKARSALEFRLRLQQFVQLASAGQAGAAIAHARAHVAPLAAGGAHLSELQCAMAFLVFRPGAPGARSPLVASAAPTWAALAEEFGAEAARVHGLPPVSGVALRLQAGLCALNTAHASREGGGGARQDPLADPLLAQLATGLPHCKHVHSRLVCPITQQVMSEDNPPAALPNGYVYSRAALEALAAEGGGTLCCPRTGSGPYDVAALQKVFIA
jgi:macrophage erythroblast attacher